MCISLGPAKFSGTILYGGLTTHPISGATIQVTGYQNTALNEADGPNAMLLRVPAASAMAADNFLDTGNDREILNDMVAALSPRLLGMSFGADFLGDAKNVLMFDHGIYTILVARNAADLYPALDGVPAAKRPALERELFEFCQSEDPNMTNILACFDTKTAQESEPLLFWYEPQDASILHLPAMDAHTGGAPDLTRPVDADTWVIVDPGADAGVSTASIVDGATPSLRPFLPRQLTGRSYAGKQQNGDFRVSRDGLGQLQVSRVSSAGEQHLGGLGRSLF
jgi:hypothetical protein